MADFPGTNGDDELTGTAADDTFDPLLGLDTVDGADGIDTLNVDYSALTDGQISKIGSNGTGSFQGNMWGGLSPYS